MQTILIGLDTRINNYASVDLMQGYNYTLEAHITDNYKDMDLTGVTVQLQMQKPDKKFIIQTENIIIEGNKIKATLDKDFTREDGQAKLQVVLLKDNFTFGSWVVKAKIKPSAINNNDGQSENKVTITEALVNKISEAENTKIELDKSIANGDVTAIKGNVDKIKDVEIPKINEQLETKASKSEVNETKRDKSILINMNDLSNDVKTAMTGGSVAVVGEDTIGKENIINKNVTAEKTDFTERINYFNYLTVSNGYINTLGNITNSGDSNYKTSDYISIGLNDVIRIKYPSKSTFPVGYALYNISKQFLSFTNFADWSSKSKITISDTNAIYIRFSFNILNDNNWQSSVMLTINRGDYEDFIQYKNVRIPNIIIDDRSISSDKLNFLSKVNFFNYIKATVNQNLNSDGTVGVLDAYTYTSEYIEIPSPSLKANIKYPNTATYELKACFYDSNKTFISSYDFATWSEKSSIDIPSNSSYIRFSFNISNDNNWQSSVMLLFDRDIPSSFIPYECIDIPSLSHVDENTENRLALLENKKTTSNFFMPNTLYLIKNRCGKRKLKLENIVNALNIDDFYIEKEGGNIYSKDKKYIILDDSVGGNSGQNVKVIDIRTLKHMYSKDLYSLRVIESAINPVANKNVLIIGDSFTDNGYLPCEIKNILVNQFGVTNLNFVGAKSFTDTNTNTTCKHQGFGGVTIMDYIKTDNTQGRGVQWSNPFLTGSTISYADYCVKNNIFGGLDYVVLEVGVNDLLALGSSVDTVIERLKTMINSIHAEYPNCKIFVVGQKYASEETIYIDSYKWNKKIVELNSKYEQTCESDTYKNYCYYVDIGVTFDKLYGSTFTMKPPYKGSDVNVISVTDWLHPNRSGYYMIAENVASAIGLNL